MYIKELRIKFANTDKAIKLDYSYLFLPLFIALQVQTDSNNETDISLVKDYIGWTISSVSGGAAAAVLIYTARTFDNNRKTTFVTTFYNIRRDN